MLEVIEKNYYDHVSAKQNIIHYFVFYLLFTYDKIYLQESTFSNSIKFSKELNNCLNLRRNLEKQRYHLIRNG